MGKGISRRDLLTALAAMAGSVGLCKTASSLRPEAKELVTPAEETEMAAEAFLPLVTKSPTAAPAPTGGRVVHTHSNAATSWDFGTGWYGDYVGQDVVNDMVDGGLKALTGQPTAAAAWQALLPGYAPGKAIAVKVNFNNCYEPEKINALIEPVNALVRGMKEAGVLEQDVWVYDARPLPTNRFCNRCLYPGVRFFGTGDATEPVTFNSNDPNAEIQFEHPSLGQTVRRLNDQIINAAYLIDMPIIKDHGASPVSLAFKNHYGSMNAVVTATDQGLHETIYAPSSLYNSNYSPLLDIWNNPHIRQKTVLIAGDALFGAFHAVGEPVPWATFGNDAPNSLLFATDPVAIDCVMFDLLDAEPVDHPRFGEEDNDLFRLAAAAGLGVFERGDPWGSGYQDIGYTKMEL